MFKGRKSRKNEATKIILGIFGAAAASIVIALAISKKEEIKNFFSEGDEEAEKNESEDSSNEKNMNATLPKVKKNRKMYGDAIEGNISSN